MGLGAVAWGVQDLRVPHPGRMDPAIPAIYRLEVFLPRPAKYGMAVVRWRDGHSFKCWELKVLIFCFCTKSCVFFLENRIAYLGPALSLFFFPPRDVYMRARSFARHPCRQHHLRQALLWPWGQWPPGTRCCPGAGWEGAPAPASP